MKTPYYMQWAAGAASIFYPNFTEKQNNLVVLTAFHGDGYRSNTKYLFEALLKHDDIEAVWATRNKSLVKDLQNKYGNKSAVLTHSLKGLKTISRTSTLIFTHGTSDFPFIRLPKRSLKIHTYHGLPTKRGEYLRPGNNKPPNWFHRKILEYRFGSINYFLSSSSAVTDIFSKRFGLEKSQFIETGFPAYDPIINQQKSPDFVQQLGDKLPDANTYFLYAPTFRKRSTTKWFPFSDKDISEIAGFLDDNNAIMVLRPHPNETVDFSRYTDISNRFVIADQHMIEDVNKLIINAAGIITDYSSIYIEGLLKDIPCIFIPYDNSSYERGFAFPYNEITPGPKVESQKDFLQSLRDCIEKPAMYRKKRESVKNHFFKKTDGMSTQRTVKFIEDLLL